MKNIGLILFLFFCSFSSNSFDKFDAMVCEASSDDSTRIQCYRNADFSSKCQNKEAAKELTCYREIGHELEKKFAESKQKEAAETALQIELKKNKYEEQSTHETLSKSQKTYTPEELRSMVQRGDYPKQGTPSSQSQSIEYMDCIVKVESVVASIKANYPKQTIVNTSLVLMVKVWTNDSAMMFTCSLIDKKLIITSAPYL